MTGGELRRIARCSTLRRYAGAQAEGRSGRMATVPSLASIVAEGAVVNRRRPVEQPTTGG
jgi:hypothetical protein